MACKVLTHMHGADYDQAQRGVERLDKIILPIEIALKTLVCSQGLHGKLVQFRLSFIHVQTGFQHETVMAIQVPDQHAGPVCPSTSADLLQ